MDCVFCKIINGEIPSPRVYEDDRMIVINDLNPRAPIHLLFIPKAHIPSAAKIDASNSAVVAAIFERIAKIAEEKGFANAYRVVTNIGKDGGQSVEHLHFHVLAGRVLTEDMG